MQINFILKSKDIHEKKLDKDNKKKRRKKKHSEWKIITTTTITTKSINCSYLMPRRRLFAEYLFY